MIMIETETLNLKPKGVKYNIALAIALLAGHNKHVEITGMFHFLSPRFVCLMFIILHNF